MLKKNSRIVLLALAGTAVAEPGLPLSLLLELPIGETRGGRRSLIYFLARQQLLWIERHQGHLMVGSTMQGRRLLSAQFPALSVKSGQEELQWQVLLLKQAPKTDPHFRSLSALCTKYRVLRLMRGVYVYPGTLPAALETQLETLYTDAHLARLTVSEWVSGLDRPVIVSYYDIENLSAIYSSISKELDQLLIPVSSENRFNYRTFSTISSILSRLESALSSDSGLTQRFFPQTPLSSQLVSRVGEVLGSLPQPEYL